MTRLRGAGRRRPPVGAEPGCGRTLHAALGHKAEHDANPRLREILKGGTQWSIEKVNL